MGKSEREKRPPGAEIAVSVLAFINASVAGDAVLKVSASSRTRRNKKADEGGIKARGKARRDKFKSAINPNNF